MNEVQRLTVALNDAHAIVKQHCATIDELQSRIEALEKDAARHQLRIETIRALFPSAPSDSELDAAIDTAMQSAQEVNRREIERKITEEGNKRLMYVDPNADWISL